MPVRIYMDTGAPIRPLQQLQRDGLVELVQFQYENRTRKITHLAPPSNPTWSQVKYSWVELPDYSWADFGKQSDKWEQIVRVVGNDCHTDAQHLDSAYMAGCEVFFTSDKDDIASKRTDLESILSLRIFHASELDQLLGYINGRASLRDASDQ